MLVVSAHLFRSFSGIHGHAFFLVLHFSEKDCTKAALKVNLIEPNIETKTVRQEKKTCFMIILIENDSFHSDAQRETLCSEGR